MPIQILEETLLQYTFVPVLVSVCVCFNYVRNGFLDLKCHEHDDVKVFAPVEGTGCIAYSQNP